MIIYLYLFIPVLCRFAESSSIKGKNHKNDLVPFLSSRLDTQKDNSLKIVSNEPFIIQFQMPPQSTENIRSWSKTKDKKKKRPDKKRVSKIKPLRKKIRKRRDASEDESRIEKRDQSTKLSTEIQSNHNKTQNFISRQEMLKALNIHLKKKETKKLKPEGIKNVKDMGKTDDTSSRNLHRNYSSFLPDREPHVKMMYPSTPKSDSHNYSYKDLIADRERLERKINYIRNMLNVNDTTAEDAVRIRRKSDSDNTANRIAKMFLTLSAVNGLHDKQSKCRDEDDDRSLDVWEEERKKSTSRQSSSSNEERYKVKKWIEYMKNKRSSGKTCPCMNGYNEENDIFPLEQKFAKGYPLREISASSEEVTDKYRDPLSHSRGRPNKSGINRNNYKEDTRSRLRALANRGRRKYDLSTDDLELYRSRARQILQNAEEILDKIKEEEEKRLAAPHALVSRLRELTSRIQGDPRNNENDLIKIIQKNLGWIPQSKSQSGADNNSFVENMKSFILDPYEKAKALTDESTKKLSSYLLRNLGKIDSSEEQEEATEKSDGPQIFHGQVPQNEEMFSANLAKENPESDLLAKDREENQNWSDTLSAILGGNEGDLGKENTEDGESKQIKGKEDSIKRRMEEMIKEQEKKISEYTEKPVDLKNDETTVIDLMTGKQKETPKDSKQSEDTEEVKEMFESEKQGKSTEKSEADAVNQNGVTENESEKVKSTAEETGSEVIASKHQQPLEDQTESEEFAESVGKNVDTEGEDDKIRPDFPLESQDVKGAIGKPSSKEDETVAKYSEDNRELENAKANENQDDDTSSERASEFEKGISNEEEQALESPREHREQDDKVQSKQDREENDVINSKHLVQEGDGQSEVEKLEEFTEDIQKLREENAGERPEETTRQVNSEEYEGTVMKKKQDSFETSDPENVAEINPSPDSVILQAETASEETQKELYPDSSTFSSEVLQISQDPKESLQYDDSKRGRFSTKKESSAEGLVENGKTEISAEDLEKTKSVEVETKKGNTLKSRLAGEAEEDVEQVRKELDNQNVNGEKEILRESLDDVEQNENYQEPSLKASLDELDNEQKSRETPLQKSLEEGEENVDVSADEETLRSENPENKTLESSSREISLQASKQARESEEFDETEDDEVSLKASAPKNIDEIRRTSNKGNSKVAESEQDNRENEDEPQLRAEQTEVEEIEMENEESPLRSENFEKDTEISNESFVNTSASQEKVEAVETLREENGETENQERIDETLKATADENDEPTQEIASAEVEKVEGQQKETENLEESSREANLNEEESIEINKPPKLLMSIKGNLGDEKETLKADQEEGNEENEALIGDILNVNEENDADVERKNMNEEVPVRAANPETDQVQSEVVQDTQEMDDEDDINVRTENMKDLNNQVDGEGLKDGKLRSAKIESEALNEDTNVKEVNSLERQEFDKDDVVKGVKQIKEPGTQQEVTVGKKKNAPASGEVQNYEQNQSKSILKVPKSIGKIMRDLDGKEKDDYTSLTNLNPEKIDHIIDKIDEAEHRNKLESEDVDCRKECACANEMNTRSRNIGRYEIVKDFLHWVKDLQLNRVLTDE